MNQSSKKTKYLVLVTMFCSIEVLLMFTPLGFIPIGPMKATTMHIPVILAGILLGIKGGAILVLSLGFRVLSMPRLIQRFYHLYLRLFIRLASITEIS